MTHRIQTDKENEIKQQWPPVCRNRNQGILEERGIKQLRITDKKGGLLEDEKAGC